MSRTDACVLWSRLGVYWEESVTWICAWRITESLRKRGKDTESIKYLEWLPPQNRDAKYFNWTLKITFIYLVCACANIYIYHGPHMDVKRLEEIGFSSNTWVPDQTQVLKFGSKPFYQLSHLAISQMFRIFIHNTKYKSKPQWDIILFQLYWLVSKRQKIANTREDIGKELLTHRGWDINHMTSLVKSVEVPLYAKNK